MYAIVEIAGKQFKVKQDQYIYAPKMEGASGKEVIFDQVLLLEDQKDIQIGIPTVRGASVTGKVVGHVQADKVIVFKKKRKKGYKKKNGHRQAYTQVLIDKILKP